MPRLNHILLALMLAAPQAARAAMLQVRGSLADAHGEPQNGACLLRFRLFGVAKDSPEAWSDSVYVAAREGGFQATLGQQKAIPENLFTEGYRIAVEAPATLHWKAIVTSIAPGASAPQARPRPARRPKAEAREEATRKPAATEETEASPRMSAPAEAERLRERLDALERKLAPARQVKVYEVQPGDTLQSVAAKLWGDSSRWPDLYNANADRIQRGGYLTAGQRLIVPSLGR